MYKDYRIMANASIKMTWSSRTYQFLNNPFPRWETLYDTIPPLHSISQLSTDYKNIKNEYTNILATTTQCKMLAIHKNSGIFIVSSYIQKHIIIKITVLLLLLNEEECVE